METAKTETAKVFDGAGEKPIPLKAVLIAKENGQKIPLQLYARNLGGGKWAIIDATNPTNPRTYTGEGMLPTDALNQAWNNFVSSTNDLPSGQIAVEKPKGLGITNENTPWNAASQGQSSLKQWADRLGKGSILLAGAGIAALLIPGGQGIGVGLLLGAGVLGGGSSAANLADRVNNGTFKLYDGETALDILGIVGGLASGGGLAAMTNAGSKGLSVLANGVKFNLIKQGNFTKIVQIAEQGTNVGGGILLANSYVEAIDKVNRSGLSSEQKKIEVQRILAQAVVGGGLIILGTGVSIKLGRATQSKNWNEVKSLIGKPIKPGEALPEGYYWNNGQIFRKQGNVDAGYTPLMVKDGKIAVRTNDRLSNPALMNKNFEDSIRANIRAKYPRLSNAQINNLVRAERNRVQIHHLIPDEIIQTSELGQAAVKAGYNLDNPNNLKGMPRKATDRLDNFDLEHRGSHPEYSKSVRIEMETAAEKLKLRYKVRTLDEVPPKEIIKEMRKIENKFRKRIETMDVEMKDGRLAYIPLQIRGNGSYEVRV